MQRAMPTMSADLTAVKDKLRGLVGEIRSGNEHKKSQGTVAATKQPQRQKHQITKVEQNKLSEAQKLYNGKKYGEAMRILKGLIHESADYPEFHFLMGSCYKNTERLSEAIESYSKAVTLDPENASYLNNRGNCLLNRGDYNSALSDFKNAIRLDPENEVYLNNLANCLVNVG